MEDTAYNSADSWFVGGMQLFTRFRVVLREGVVSQSLRNTTIQVVQLWSRSVGNPTDFPLAPPPPTTKHIAEGQTAALK